MGDFVVILESSDEALKEFVSKRLTDNALTVRSFKHPDKQNATAFIVSAPLSVISKEAEAWGFLKKDEKGFKRDYVNTQQGRFQIPYTSQGETKSLFTPSEISYITYEVIKRITVKYC